MTIHITKTEGVCGGRACVKDTRIPVWVIEQHLRLGKTEKEIQEIYPSLGAYDLVYAVEYARCHKAEIEKDIRENSGCVEVDANAAEIALGCMRMIIENGIGVSTPFRSMLDKYIPHFETALGKI